MHKSTPTPSFAYLLNIEPIQLVPTHTASITLNFQIPPKLFT